MIVTTNQVGGINLKKFLDKWIPQLWAMLLIFIITGAAFGAAIAILKWIMNLIGVGA